MKTSRRQQLRTNELAQYLASGIEFLKTNSGTVAVGVAAVIVVIGLGVYWYSAKASRRDQGWIDFYGSQLVGAPDGRLAAVQAVANKYKDPALASFAWLTYGEGTLQQAKSPSCPPADRQRLLNEAAGAFQSVIDHYADQTLAVAGARFKLAALAENGRQWDQARMHYKALIEDPRFANLPQRERAITAERRLDEIRQAIIFAPPPTTAPTGRADATTRPQAKGNPSARAAASRAATRTAK